MLAGNAATDRLRLGLTYWCSGRENDEAGAPAAASGVKDLFLSASDALWLGRREEGGRGSEERSHVMWGGNRLIR